MATIANPQDEEAQSANTGATGTPNGPVQVSGTGGASSTSIGGAPAGSGQGTPGAAAPSGVSPVSQNQSGNQNRGYTDVSSYLNANQAGSQQLAGQVANNLTNDYNSTTGVINGSANNTINLVNAGYTPENDQLVQQAAANPSSFVASNPNNVAGFQAQLNDTYSGPSSWADITNPDGSVTPGYGTLQGNVSNAQQEGSLVNTPGGNNVLAQDVEGNNTSQGINQLDALLLGSDPNAQATVQAASAPFAGLNTYLNSQNSAVGTDINNATAGAAGAASNANNAFLGPSGVVPTWETQLQNNLTTDQNAVNQANSQIGANNAIASPLEQDYQAYIGNGGYGFDNPLEGLINAAPIAQPNISQAASSQDAATQAALQQLLGGQFTSQIDPTQAGSFQTPQVGAANAQSLSQQLADLATQATYQHQELPSLQKEASYLNGGFNNAPLEAKIAGDMSETANAPESQVIGSPGTIVTNPSSVPQPFDAAAYEQLLQVLQNNDPNIIGTGAGGINSPYKGQNYYVNS